MTDPARIKYLVERYPRLQGLRLVPLGILFLFVALWRDGQLRWLPGADGDGPYRWFMGGLAVAIASSYGIAAFYRHRYGMVTTRPFAGGGPQMMAIATLIFASLVLQDIYRWRVSVPLIVVGAVLGYVGVADGRRRQHYLWIAGACVALANIGDFGVLARTQHVMRDLLIAGSLLVAGIGDHLLLRRLMEPSQPAPHAERSV